LMVKHASFSEGVMKLKTIRKRRRGYPPKALRMLSEYGGLRTPFSVMKPVTYLAGVTSKAGFLAGVPLAAMRTLEGAPSSPTPHIPSTSSASRSSISISSPVPHFRSKVIRGAAT